MHCTAEPSDIATVACSALPVVTNIDGPARARRPWELHLDHLVVVVGAAPLPLNTGFFNQTLSAVTSNPLNSSAVKSGQLCGRLAFNKPRAAFALLGIHQ
jgi:hypothetical protein